MFYIGLCYTLLFAIACLSFPIIVFHFEKKADNRRKHLDAQYQQLLEEFVMAHRKSCPLDVDNSWNKKETTNVSRN